MIKGILVPSNVQVIGAGLEDDRNDEVIPDKVRWKLKHLPQVFALILGEEFSKWRKFVSDYGL